jgi:beta-1,4-mannosyl-glycoprotein beta-1,4-N-acetylglucosaminyltransferase
VFDCFPFYNELDILEIRLNVLNEVVDYFILVESTRTFSGKKKELVFDKNKDRFSEFKHKIRHVVIDDSEYDSDVGV